MSKLKDALIDKNEADEAMKGLCLWSALGLVAEAIVEEVNQGGDSPTLTALYDKIRTLVKDHE